MIRRGTITEINSGEITVSLDEGGKISATMQTPLAEPSVGQRGDLFDATIHGTQIWTWEPFRSRDETELEVSER